MARNDDLDHRVKHALEIVRRLVICRNAIAADLYIHEWKAARAHLIELTNDLEDLSGTLHSIRIKL